MKKKFKFGVIGAGLMSTAIVKGVINSELLASSKIIVSDISNENLSKISELGVNVTLDNKYLVNNAEFVMFAIKPQNSPEVLEEIKDCKCDKFISIMAGVKKEKIKYYFPNSSVARCMPNTPCSIGSGAVGIDLLDYNNEKDIQFIKTLFSALGSVVLLEEKQLNAVTGVSGSSPAYFYLFLKGVIDAGIRQGLTLEDAKMLAVSTMIGAGKMVQNNPNKSIDDLINAVCSKGGTTIEAIKVYNDMGLNSITDKAINACVKKSIELENL